MPIRPYLDGQKFDLETILMGLAFEMARVGLGLSDRDEPAKEIVAKRIIELAKAGERNLDLLCDDILKGTSNNVRGHKFGLGPVFDCLPGFFFRPLLRLEHFRRLHRLHAAASRSSVTRRRML
jgi:hypothetical protein